MRYKIKMKIKRIMQNENNWDLNNTLYDQFEEMLKNSHALIKEDPRVTRTNNVTKQFLYNENKKDVRQKKNKENQEI